MFIGQFNRNLISKNINYIFNTCLLVNFAEIWFLSSKRPLLKNSAMNFEIHILKQIQKKKSQLTTASKSPQISEKSRRENWSRRGNADTQIFYFDLNTFLENDVRGQKTLKELCPWRS